MNGDTVQLGARRDGRGRAGPVASRPRSRRSPASRSTRQTAAAAADAAVRDARPLSQNGYKIQVAKTAVKRAILHAAGIKTV